jgi:hypothetical protein
MAPMSPALQRDSATWPWAAPVAIHGGISRRRRQVIRYPMVEGETRRRRGQTFPKICLDRRAHDAFLRHR